MSALVIRIIAILTMLSDHLGSTFGIPALNVVGRLAFPLFAFLIANGFKYSKNVKLYALRLFVFAILSEIPFDLFTKGEISLVSLGGLLPNIMLDNVFFTLLLGLVFLWLNDIYKKKNLKLAKLLSAVTFLVIGSVAAFISSDYGAVGVAWVALFGLLDVEKKENRPALVFGSVALASWHVITKSFALGVITLTTVNISKIIPISYFIYSTKVNMSDRVQIVSALAIVLILLYNGRSGMPKSRAIKNTLQYAFYCFYPAHLVLLYYIAYFMLQK